MGVRTNVSKAPLIVLGTKEWQANLIICGYLAVVWGLLYWHGMTSTTMILGMTGFAVMMGYLHVQRFTKPQGKPAWMKSFVRELPDGFRIVNYVDTNVIGLIGIAFGVGVVAFPLDEGAPPAAVFVPFCVLMFFFGLSTITGMTLTLSGNRRLNLRAGILFRQQLDISEWTVLEASPLGTFVGVGKAELRAGTVPESARLRTWVLGVPCPVQFRRMMINVQLLSGLDIGELDRRLKALIDAHGPQAKPVETWRPSRGAEARGAGARAIETERFEARGAEN